MSIKRIYSRCPVRIDLAGGTVDIWPLYLLLQDPLTINLAIDLYAETEITLSEGKELHLISDDQNFSKSMPWQDIQKSMPSIPQLDLHLRMMRYYFKNLISDEQRQWISKQKLTLKTKAQSPAGAGLGGSSALSISIIGAIDRLFNLQSDPIVLIDRVRDLEAQVIAVPTGLQDYYGAMFGGLQEIRWGIQRHSTTSLSAQTAQQLSERILLCYSGRSRNSGINNWSLFKDFLDQKNSVPRHFQTIVNATRDLSAAIASQQWQKIGQAIRQDWEIRKSLASGITTDEMESAFKICQKHDVQSYNVCGAGGGGCFFIYFDDADLQSAQIKKKKVMQLLQSELQDLKPLKFNYSAQGLFVQ